MNPWVESLGVSLLAAGGMFLGAWFSRLPRHWWLVGYFLPLSLVIIYDIGNRHPALALTPPVSWMMLGRIDSPPPGLWLPWSSPRHCSSFRAVATGSPSSP